MLEFNKNNGYNNNIGPLKNIEILSIENYGSRFGFLLNLKKEQFEIKDDLIQSLF